MRRAKIIATLGPSTETYEKVLEIVQAGVDVARLNLNHGEHALHEQAYAHVRRASEETGRAVGVLVDLQGPKIRLGRFAHAPHTLVRGDEFTLTTEDVEGTWEIVSTTYPNIASEVGPGDEIFVDDGRVRLRVLDADGVRVRTEVVAGGEVADGMGVNVPGVAVETPPMSEKDEADLRWALRLGADMVALSFVRIARDAHRAHVIMAEEGRDVPLIAKIERPEAVEALQDIIDAFDGLMVARGDLGLELPLEAVPIVQKRAIELARRWAKPVIVTTQMLESMIGNPVPTRAETSDVANAVVDGADAVMLSGETAVGAHPVTAVETMARIIATTEQHGLGRIPPLGTKPHTQAGAITLAAVEIAEFVGARYLCVFSQSGDSARRMSRLRHPIPIASFTDLPSTRASNAMLWGVQTFLVPRVRTSDELMELIDDTLLGNGMAEAGDRVVATAGAPPGIAGSTNNVRVHIVGTGGRETMPDVSADSEP
jgi:pyruvate kinase